MAVVAALLAIGLVALYSATAVSAERSERYHDAGWFLKRQLVWTALSILAMIVTARVPYATWARWRWPLLGGCIVLLSLVFVPGVGAQINGARRWIKLGPLFFQPSEAAKLGVALFLAAFASSRKDRMGSFASGFIPAFAILAGVCGLILVEPDVGTSVFIGLVMTLMLIVAGVKIRHIVPVGTAAAVGGACYLMTHTAHVAARLEAWLHPERDPLGKGHQILQSLTALGSGGWFGVGLGRGTSKLSFLPEVHSDFIFPVIGEEAGFLGAAGVMLLYAGLGWAGYRVMQRAPGRFGFLLAFALTTYILLQAAMNVAVVTAAMPTKGIPLPFVSAGGSSLLFTMAAAGMLVNIANAAERGACREGDDVFFSPVAAPAAISSRA